MQASNKNIHSLHIIRGLAALVVVIYHAKFILWAGGSLWLQQHGFHSLMDYILFGMDMLSSCGEQCVLIFFLLSGFVIYHSFQHSDRSVKHFFIIRGLRIYIPYLVSMVLSVVVLVVVVKMNNGIAVAGVREYNTRLLTAYNETGIANIIRSIFFVKGNEYAGFNFVYWSLLHEAIFYMVFPVYFYAGKKGRGICLLINVAAYLLTQQPVFYFQLFFLAGMFLYDYYEQGRTLFLRSKALYLPLIAVLYIATNLLTKLPVQHIANMAALLLAVVSFDYLLTGRQHNKLFTRLADISFSLYLNHLWVLLICYAVAVRYFNELVIYQRWPYYVSVLITLPVAGLLYRLVEKRSLTLIAAVKKSWKKRS